MVLGSASALEAALVVGALVAAIAALARAGVARRRPGAWLGAAMAAAAGAFVWSNTGARADREARAATAAELAHDPAFPKTSPRGEYVGSAACAPCHAGEHASWHRSFHRTMTQAALGDAVVAPPAGRLALDGAAWSFARDERGGGFWAVAPDGGRKRVLLATGSHHYQGYWTAGDAPTELRMFPFVWLVGERRWIPRRDAFLQPPDAPPQAVRWNSNCVACHAVAGRPRQDEAKDRFATEVVELGVACEACHGPGGEHARKNADPAARYASHLAGEDRSIVNPARLPRDRSNEVCGQCHAYAWPNDEDDFWANGYATSFRPGDPLARSRTLLTSGLDGVFWSDGTVRVGGREHSGLQASKCRAACISCHAMHGDEPDDQLAAAAHGDGACAKCHRDVAARGAEHTHHAAGSPGAACYGCHMPKTSYALLGAMRSHRIDSPAVSGGDRPNACNLCHLDRSLAWTADWLARWYGEGEAAAGGAGEAGTAPAALGWLLAGDAAQRAIVAAGSSAPEAIAASGSAWQPRLLAELLDDRYAAVRLVACRALHELPGWANAACARDAVLSRARPDDDAAIARALARRDDRPVTISE